MQFEKCFSDVMLIVNSATEFLQEFNNCFLRSYTESATKCFIGIHCPRKLIGVYHSGIYVHVLSKGVKIKSRKCTQHAGHILLNSLLWALGSIAYTCM